MVKLQCDQLDQEEVFEVTDGEGSTLATMTPEQLRGLVVNVALVMTQRTQESDIAAAEAAIGAVERYMMIPDPMKAQVRPMFIQILETLDFKDADKALPLPVVILGPDGRPMIDPEAGAAGGVVQPFPKSPGPTGAAQNPQQRKPMMSEQGSDDASLGMANA